MGMTANKGKPVVLETRSDRRNKVTKDFQNRCAAPFFDGTGLEVLHMYTCSSCRDRHLSLRSRGQGVAKVRIPSQDDLDQKHVLMRLMHN